jgi:hypothetical protein
MDNRNRNVGEINEEFCDFAHDLSVSVGADCTLNPTGCPSNSSCQEFSNVCKLLIDPCGAPNPCTAAINKDPSKADFKDCVPSAMTARGLDCLRSTESPTTTTTTIPAATTTTTTAMPTESPTVSSCDPGRGCASSDLFCTTDNKCIKATPCALAYDQIRAKCKYARGGAHRFAATDLPKLFDAAKNGKATEASAALCTDLDIAYRCNQEAFEHNSCTDKLPFEFDCPTWGMSLSKIHCNVCVVKPSQSSTGPAENGSLATFVHDDSGAVQLRLSVSLVMLAFALMLSN